MSGHQLGGIGYRLLRPHRPVGLHRQGQAVEVGPLADPGLLHIEVRTKHGTVDRVDDDQVHRIIFATLVLVRQHESTAPVDPQFHAKRPILRQLLLQREQVPIPVDDLDLRIRLDLARRDGARLTNDQLQLRLILTAGQPDDQAFQLLDDLVDILYDAVDRLVLVHHAACTERPHGPARQRREEDSPSGVAQGLSVAPLQGLNQKLGATPVFGRLGNFNSLG